MLKNLNYFSGREYIEGIIFKYNYLGGLKKWNIVLIILKTNILLIFSRNYIDYLLQVEYIMYIELDNNKNRNTLKK